MIEILCVDGNMRWFSKGNNYYSCERPNSSQCEGCPNWDDVNACWADVEDVDSCDKINDEGYYSLYEDDEDDEYPGE